MADEVPKLADWLAELRSRPEPIEVVICEADVSDPGSPDLARLRVARYENPEGRSSKQGFYVFGYAHDGGFLFDLWFEELADAIEDAEDNFGLRRAAWRPQPPI